MSCEYKGKCGGCYYIDINYKEELRLKEAKVLSLINKSFDIDSELPTDKYIYDGIIASPLEKEYKNKMEFTFGDSEKNGPLTLGMHEKRAFFNILNADNCELADDVMREIIKVTCDFFDSRNVPYYHKKSHLGFLRHLVLRKSFKNNEYIVNLVTSSQDVLIDGETYDTKKLLNEWADEIKNKIAKIKSTDLPVDLQGDFSTDTQGDSFGGERVSSLVKLNIIHTTNDSLSDAVINEGYEILEGKDIIEESVCGKNFNISPFSFFQTNTKACEKLYEKIREYAENVNKSQLLNSSANSSTSLISPTSSSDLPVIYDMFCGTGTIGIILSDLAKKIIGVEIVKEAIDKAKENCLKNGVENAEYIAKDINQVVKDRDKIVFDNKPDLIILDPPRGGVNDRTLESILELQAKAIIYVSCKIESFINNLSILKSHGYNIKKISIVDMFPRTDNVETVILLKKNK